MEWIQQNRPRSPDVFQRGGGGPGSGGGIGGDVMNNGAGLSTSEKIPYYGRYCGSFFEHQVEKLKLIIKIQINK
jgi:hypothetical protein